jgi:hypothetical protein
LVLVLLLLLLVVVVVVPPLVLPEKGSWRCRRWRRRRLLAPL